jgi:hypothetical protein
MDSRPMFPLGFAVATGKDSMQFGSPDISVCQIGPGLITTAHSSLPPSTVDVINFEQTDV